MTVLWHAQAGPRTLPNALTTILSPPAMAQEINPVVVQKVIITCTITATIGTTGGSVRMQIMQGTAGAIIADGRMSGVAGQGYSFMLRVEDPPDFMANGGQYRMRANGPSQTATGTIDICDMTVESFP